MNLEMAAEIDELVRLRKGKQVMGAEDRLCERRVTRCYHGGSVRAEVVKGVLDANFLQSPY